MKQPTDFDLVESLRKKYPQYRDAIANLFQEEDGRMVTNPTVGRYLAQAVLNDPRTDLAAKRQAWVLLKRINQGN